jgi:hypothetical protein
VVIAGGNVGEKLVLDAQMYKRVSIENLWICLIEVPAGNQRAFQLRKKNDLVTGRSIEPC